MYQVPGGYGPAPAGYTTTSRCKKGKKEQSNIKFQCLRLSERRYLSLNSEDTEEGKIVRVNIHLLLDPSCLQ